MSEIHVGDCLRQQGGELSAPEFVASGSERVMKSRIVTLCLVFVGLAPAALAHGGHGHGGHRHGGHFGLFIGAPWGWYYPPPYWYSPPVVVQSAPPVYIERDPAPSAPDDEAYYWYHCSRPEGYYPYIKECPGGWKKVVPTPPK